MLFYGGIKLSIAKRKIGYYALQLTENGEPVDPSILKDILKYIDNLNQQNRINNIARQNKGHLLKNLSFNSEDNTHYVTMASGKYHHRPPLINMNDASTRENPKTLVEAEEELTHIALRFNEDEIITLLEERRSGIHINTFADYLKRYTRLYLEKQKKPMKYDIDHCIIPMDDFLEELGRLDRVFEGRIYTTNQIMGSEFLNFSNKLEEAQEEITITVKAQKRKSIRDIIRTCYENFQTKKTVMTKIRVVGYNETGQQILLDTDYAKRVKYINVNPDNETGTIVDSPEIFTQMTHLIWNLTGDE